MSLLTASESHAFQSFLSSMASPDPAPEWSVYPPSSDAVDIPLGKEALAKATKDLMSLDAGRWNQGHPPFYEDRALLPPPQSDYTYLQPSPFQHQSSSSVHYLKPLHTQHHSFHHPSRSTLPQQHHSSYATSHQHLRHLPSIAIAPLHTLGGHTSETPPLSSSSTSTAHSIAQPHLPSPSPSISAKHQSRMSPPTSAKRPLPHDLSAGSSNKRSRPSPTLPPLAASTSTADGSNPAPVGSQRTTSLPRTSTGSGKPTLLSPSQKKANHIQSEQKRRANIRRGYEKLCETVPALRDALRDDDGGDGSYDDRSGKGRGKRGRGRGREDGEKVDGRAGPRSENVVLGKTIEYINELLAERSGLLSRLQRARSALPRGHPTLVPRCMRESGGTQIPLWEREWKGGEGRNGSGDEDEDDDED